MGNFVSGPDKAGKARSNAIDRQIEQDSKKFRKECKILLLGAFRKSFFFFSKTGALRCKVYRQNLWVEFPFVKRMQSMMLILALPSLENLRSLSSHADYVTPQAQASLENRPSSSK
jgi:hypothetical protein